MYSHIKMCQLNGTSHSPVVTYFDELDPYYLSAFYVNVVQGM